MAEKITIRVTFGQSAVSMGSIGRVGENISRQILFDCSSALAGRTNASIICAIKRPGDNAPYPGTLTHAEGTSMYKLVLTSAEVAVAGTVQFELRMVDGEEILKSAIYTGSVTSSMTGLADTPELPLPDALNRLESAITEVDKYADLKEKVDALESGQITAEDPTETKETQPSQEGAQETPEDTAEPEAVQYALDGSQLATEDAEETEESQVAETPIKCLKQAGNPFYPFTIAEAVKYGNGTVAKIIEKLIAAFPDENFSTAQLERTAGEVTNTEYWFFVNAKWNEETKRFQRININNVSFGIQMQASGTYPGEETLGYNHNQSIGYWKANGRGVFLDSGDTASAEALTEDIGTYVDGEWRDFGVYFGWNNCFMLDSYGGMTIGGAGFEVDGNGISPFMRVTLSKREEVPGKGYAFMGLLWNAQHGFWNSDLKDIGDLSVGIKAPITYTYDGDYDPSSNRADITNASFVVMRRAPNADYNDNNMRPLYEFDQEGVLHVDKATYIEVEASVFDSSSAQILYPAGITKDNVKIISAYGKIDGSRVDVEPLNVNLTDAGVLFNYSNGAQVSDMKVIVADKTKMCKIDLFALAKLLEAQES